MPEKDAGTPKTNKRKVAAFDLVRPPPTNYGQKANTLQDSTLITSASGKRHADDPTDWKWWHHSVPARLKQLQGEGWVLTCDGKQLLTTLRFQIVVLTNQGGLTLHTDPKAKAPKSLKNRVATFKQKCNAVLTQLDLPITLYAATAKDIFRKPRTGMWKEMKDDYNLTEADIDHENSIFVGDAGGRTAQLRGGTAIPKDFSCSDRNLAHNIGIIFKTPEEFFLDEKPRDFARDFDLVNFPFAESDVKFEKTNKKDVVLFVGPPGAGKSTFFWKHLKPLGYERINQDKLKR